MVDSIPTQAFGELVVDPASPTESASERWNDRTADNTSTNGKAPAKVYIDW